MRVRSAWCWESQKTISTGTFRARTPKYSISRAASGVPENPENKTKWTRVGNVKVMGSRKSIWKQICQCETVVGWSSPGRRREANWPPLPPQPWVTKAAALGESCKLRFREGLPEAAGETQVTWSGWGNGGGTGFYTDLCFRKTKEAKMKTKVSLAPIARNWVPS